MSKPKNPFEVFGQWFEEAKRTDIKEPTAMALATSGKGGRPSVRMVLMKEFSERGFVFYTNLGSDKAQDLAKNKKASVCFYWMQLNKQVRVWGKVKTVGNDEADVYFATRPRLSQIAAWASNQSRQMKSRFDLEKRVVFYTAKFAARKVPRPPFWSGFRLVPEQIEFWTQKPFRLHERILFVKDLKDWKTIRLYP